MKEQTKEMTPLQRLIEFIEISIAITYRIDNPISRASFRAIYEKAKELLPEERKAIEDAAAWGNGRASVDDKHGLAEIYFTDKYGQ